MGAAKRARYVRGGTTVTDTETGEWTRTLSKGGAQVIAKALNDNTLDRKNINWRTTAESTKEKP